MPTYKGFAAQTDKGTPCYVINEDATRYCVVLGAALVTKGYRMQHRRYIPTAGIHDRRFEYYYHTQKDQLLILEVVSVEIGPHGQEVEVTCELLKPVSNTSDVARTIAAIP